MLLILLMGVALTGMSCDKRVTAPDTATTTAPARDTLQSESGLGTVTDSVRRPAAVPSATVNLISWRYTSASYTTVNPLSEVYSGNIGLDFNAYAKNKYNRTAYAYLIANNAYSWRIKYWNGSQWIVKSIDVLDAARMQFNRAHPYTFLKNWGTTMLNYNDPYSWRAHYISKL